jgi:hypothetical protein
VAVIDGRRGDLVVLTAPRWREQRLTREEQFVGAACWRPRTRELFVARLQGHEGGDDGLWRLDTGRRTRRQVLEPVDAGYSASSTVRLSPSGRRVAAGGVVSGALAMRVRDLRSERRWSPFPSDPLPGGVDFAWLGEERLLVAAGSMRENVAATSGARSLVATSFPEAGLLVVDFRSGQLRPWLYPRGTEVLFVRRAPGALDRYAVGLGDAKAHSALPPMARRVEIVDGQSRARRLLRLPAPAHVAGFSSDGRSLLLLMLRRAYGKDLADAVTLELSSGSRRLVARGVSEAAWLSP